MKPLIGILMRPEHSIDGNDLYCAYRQIHDAILLSGGRTIGIIPNLVGSMYGLIPADTQKMSSTSFEELKEILLMCDGVIAQGGDDYCQYDLQVLSYCHDVDKPVFGICLGMQTLSVLMNGVMQEVTSNVCHKVGKKDYVHLVHVSPQSKLYDIVGEENFLVNSSHKSCIAHTDLVVSAISPDGIIEAVEDSSKSFFIGVQWHPETMIEYDVISQKLFSYFIECCRKK